MEKGNKLQLNFQETRIIKVNLNHEDAFEKPKTK